MMRSDVGYTVAVWVEMFFYAIYACLFGYSLHLMSRKRSSDRTRRLSSSVFFVVTALMFMVATFHLFTQLYRYIRAFILGVDPHGYLSYMYDFRRWDNEASNVSIVVMTWLGDGLVIYRCYLVWNSNVWVVVIPILLQVFAIGVCFPVAALRAFLIILGVNTATFIWFQYPTAIPSSVGRTLLTLIYPIAFIRNVMTTGLIGLKIWRQHRASSASGLVDRGSRLSLVRLLRIIIESAMIYTLQLFVLVILYFLNSDFQIILQSAIVPSVGLVFVLIAVRVHVIKEQPTTTVPAWLGASSIGGQDVDESLPSAEHGVAFMVDVEKLGKVDESEPFSRSLSKIYPNRSLEGEIP